jgi:hypothetical protein
MDWILELDLETPASCLTFSVEVPEPNKQPLWLSVPKTQVADLFWVPQAPPLFLKLQVGQHSASPWTLSGLSAKPGEAEPVAMWETAWVFVTVAPALPSLSLVGTASQGSAENRTYRLCVDLEICCAELEHDDRG